MADPSRRLLVRYILAYLLASVVVQAIEWLWIWLAPEMKTPSGLAFVPALIAATDSGQYYFKTYNARPANLFSWKISVLFMLVSLTISLLLFLLLGVFGSSAYVMLLQVDLQIFAIVAVVFLIIHLLIIRFMFAMGARTMANAAEK